MGLIAYWFAQRRHGGRPRAIVKGVAAHGRRLSFEHCERRLTLSAAAGSLAESSTASPADEGGVISLFAGGSPLEGDFVQTSQFALNLATNAWQSTPERIDFRIDGKFIDWIARSPSIRALAARSLALSDLAFDAGPRVIHNAFRPSDEKGVDIGGASESFYSESDVGSYLNTDSTSTFGELGAATGNVLPITPADPVAPHEGGHIAMTAYAGLSPLGLPGSSSSSVAARASIQDEGGVRPSNDGGDAVNGLRGRAVVYEVAQSAARQVHSLQASSDSLRTETPPSRHGISTAVLLTAGSQAKSTNQHVGDVDAVESISRSPEAPRVAAASRDGDPIAAQVVDDCHGSRQNESNPAGAQADHDAAVAAIDAAFATESGEISGVVQESRGLAAFADRHQRHLLGAAAALVAGGGPLGKALLRRWHRDLVEQRPPHRRLNMMRRWR